MYHTYVSDASSQYARSDNYVSMGLHAFIVRMLFAPQTFVYLPKWNPERVAESIQKYQVTSLSMVPSMAHQLATHAKLRKVNLDGILSINTGAAYLPPELRNKLTQRAKNVISLTEGYGMSECVCAETRRMFGLGAYFCSDCGSDCRTHQAALSANTACTRFDWRPHSVYAGSHCPRGWIRCGA